MINDASETLIDDRFEVIFAICSETEHVSFLTLWNGAVALSERER